MTRTLNGCPVCASTRGYSGVIYNWMCSDCGAGTMRPAQITVPRSITEMVADTEAARQTWLADGNTGLIDPLPAVIDEMNAAIDRAEASE